MIKVTTAYGIQMLHTVPVTSEERGSKYLNATVDALSLGKIEEYCFTCEEKGSTETATTLVIDESKLKNPESQRLDHWRMAHRTSTGARFTEQCQCCDRTTLSFQYAAYPSSEGTGNHPMNSLPGEFCISIKRKESALPKTVYAQFDPASGIKPRILCEDFILIKKT